jgi:hypothetical protein
MSPYFIFPSTFSNSIATITLFSITVCLGISYHVFHVSFIICHQVLFSDDFRRSFGKLTGFRLKKQVLNLLLKLSSGWRPKNRSVDVCCEKSSQILKQFKVEGFYVICTIDIIKEVKYIQVLKVWDILSLDEIPKLTKRLDNIFSAYADAYINMCTEKCLEGYVHLLSSES